MCWFSAQSASFKAVPLIGLRYPALFDADREAGEMAMPMLSALCPLNEVYLLFTVC